MNMKKNKQVFQDQNRILPTLYYYMVFVQSIRPVLFACRDDASNVYLCSCHCSSGEKTEWIIAPTTYDRLVRLLTDKITIRDAFTQDNSELYVATMKAGHQSVTVVPKQLQAVAAILPTAGYYMEAELGEFEEELEELRTEGTRQAGFIQISFRSSFFALANYFPVHVSVSEPAAVARTAACSTNRLSGKGKVQLMIP